VNPQDYFGKDYKQFDCEDPFNDNQVQGYISHRNDDSYGAILIESINFEKCFQLIYCTPKIAYPFDKTGNWHFPKAVKIERYEKIDGTNIFSYCYQDVEGNIFVAHKTRLLPFVRNGKFGAFRDMLEEIWSKNENLKMLPKKAGCNISFELWGAKNQHLIKYDKPLELSILFTRFGRTIFPSSILNISNVHCAPLLGIIDKDYVWNYQEFQIDMDKNLRSEEDGYYSGREGEVWYLLTEDGDWRLYKCKPETIEAIHWAAGGIGKNQIIATCENAFENWDNPTVENIVSLLLEEFSKELITRIYDNIGKYLKEVINKHEFIECVLKDYDALGMNILEDKRSVMRALSEKYKKIEMKKVFSTIWNHIQK